MVQQLVRVAWDWHNLQKADTASSGPKYAMVVEWWLRPLANMATPCAAASIMSQERVHTVVDLAGCVVAVAAVQLCQRHPQRLRGEEQREDDAHRVHAGRPPAVTFLIFFAGSRIVQELGLGPCARSQHGTIRYKEETLDQLYMHLYKIKFSLLNNLHLN